MAKKNKKVSYNPIQSIMEDWELDSRNNLPYSGESVQSFLKNTLKSKTGYRVTSEKRETDGYFHTRNFADRASYKAWVLDPAGNSALLLQDEILPDTHEQGASYVVGLATASNQSLIVSTDGTVKLKMKFTSQMYNPILQTTEETGESGTLTIERRADSTSQWRKVGTVSIMSVPYDSNQYTDIDISDILEAGSQQIRVIVKGDNSGESTKYISFVSIIKTTLALSFATQWQTPITEDVMLLSYYMQGAVAKTLHVRVYGIDGVSYRDTQFSIGSSVFTETPKTFEFRDTDSDQVKVLEHGIHKIEAWLTVDGGDTTTDKIYSQVMVASDSQNTNTYVIVNNVKQKVDNWTETNLFNYSVYNPSGQPTDIVFDITDYKGTSSYLHYVASNIESGVIIPFNNMFEIESTSQTLNAYVHIKDSLNTELANVVSMVVDNSSNFAAVSGASFILNPKVRSNSESNPNTITNSANGDSVGSTFTNFAFTNDGWVDDENGVKCLRVPAGRELDIDYESFTDFIGTTQNTASLSFEFDFKTRYISDETLPILRMCSYNTNGNPIGFELRPLEAVFMTGSKQTRRDQDIMFQEGVRTHVAVNIIYNIAQTGMNYIRIFVNGIINREIEYLANDSFVGYVSNVQTSQGIRIGSTGADIDIYSIRVYKKKLSATDIRQNYISALPTAQEKIAFRDSNDILSDDGTISFSKTFEKYNCLIWTGKVPSYIQKDGVADGGTLQIHIQDDALHSGVINNMGIKGQGSSSKGYWKWNHQYAMNSDSVFVSEDGVTTINGAYQLTSDSPAAIKLVSKLNWASSMQSHKMGETNAYNDLWKKIVGGNTITQTPGYENCRVAVIEKPFFYFIKETPDSEPIFYGMVTFGSAKADKPTFGYDKNKFPDILMLEGSDNGKPLTEHRVPWMDDEVSYNAKEEAFIYNKEVSWDYDMGNLNMASYFKNAFNYVFQHNLNILPHEGNLTALKGDSDASINVQYWVTEAEGSVRQYDLFRWDFITNSWVPASISKTGGVYDSFNIDDQCGNIASGVDWNSINTMFINARIQDIRTNLSNYYNLTDLFFTMSEMKKIGASDNRCKNIYPYLDPGETKVIRWFQDDTDTILQTDNVGRKNKPYYVEEHDVDASGNGYWNGESNVLFNLVEQSFPDELRAMMNTILTTMSEMEGSPTKFMEKYFFSTQRYFPAVAYNEVARLLYEEASIAATNGVYSNATAPIVQSLGDQLQAELQWWKRREIYLSSYAGYGEFTVRGNNCLMFRSIKNIDGTNPTYSFKLTPAMWLYVQGGVGQTMFYGKGKTRPQRVRAGETYILDDMTADGNTDVFINGANYYKSFGPFGNKALGEAFQLFGERLTEFSVEATDGVVEFRPNSMTINCPVLKTFTLKNVQTLLGTLDISNSNVINKFDASGTTLNSFLFPSTPTLVDITLPEWISNLTLDGLTNLQSSKLKLDSYSNLSTVHITNCPSLNILSIITTAHLAGATLDNVIADNINWIINDTTLITKLVNNKAKLSGKIQLGAGVTVDAALKLKMVETWGLIDSSSNLLYIRYQGSTLSSISITGGGYFTKAGKYQLGIIGNPVNGNDLIAVNWSMNSNRWATINQKTGEVTVTLTGLSTDVPLPTAYVTCEITKADQSVISATLQIYFYEKKVALGDIVYADGTYSDVYNPLKTAIGVCFYINPDDDTDRRMVAISDISKDMWGLFNNSTSGVAGIKLTDRPNYDCYDVAILDNITSNGTDYVTEAKYAGGDAVDADGFKLFPENSAVGQLKKKQVVLPEGLGEFSTGDYIPYGQYNTLLIIKHRNIILSDSGVNLPVPTAGSLTEYSHLQQCMIDIVSNNNSNYRQYYYPAASMCYAYEPSVKKGEVLDDRFKAHKWWLPSAGELARICYYKLQGFDYTNPKAIFAKAYNAGILTFPSDFAWSSTEYSATGSWGIRFSDGYVNGSNGGKSYSYSVRAVTAF